MEPGRGADRPPGARPAAAPPGHRCRHGRRARGTVPGRAGRPDPARPGAVLPGPALAQSLRASRYFLARAVRYLASHEGVAQFLDIGCGLPTVDNTHEIAQAARPGATVVYADADPLVVTHARAILTGGPGGLVGHVTADLRDPADLIAAAAAFL